MQCSEGLSKKYYKKCLGLGGIELGLSRHDAINSTSCTINTSALNKYLWHFSLDWFFFFCYSRCEELNLYIGLVNYDF